MRNRKKRGMWLTSMEEKVYVLTERIAALEAENEKLKKQSDKWMIDFGMACKEIEELKAQVERLMAPMTLNKKEQGC